MGLDVTLLAARDLLRPLGLSGRLLLGLRNWLRTLLPGHGRLLPAIGRSGL